MIELKVGEVYTTGKSSREITKIDGGDIYYKTEKGRSGFCWVTTFQDWIKKGMSSKESVSFKYEISYTKNGTEYITTDNISDLNKAKTKAEKIKESKDVLNVKIIEYKTSAKIIEL